MELITYQIFSVDRIYEIEVEGRSFVALPPQSRKLELSRQWIPDYPIDPVTRRGLTSKSEVEKWQPI